MRRSSAIALLVIVAMGMSGLPGCGDPIEGPQRGLAGMPASNSAREDAAGRTYYIDGAGNWGYGVLEVHEGLRKAGYRGNIINFRWSPTFNPALDQTIGRPVARARGKDLAREINAYNKQYPNAQVNIIALSAGTGVAVWACEAVRPPATVTNLILLGSSLSSDYDMREALRHISGGVWVYYSSFDQVLAGPVQALGTIDGKMGVNAAGTAGLQPPGGGDKKIHNIGWSPSFERYGWTGAHTDSTSEPFVRAELSRHVVQRNSPGPPQPSATRHAAAPAHGPSAG